MMDGIEAHNTKAEKASPMSQAIEDRVREIALAVIREHFKAAVPTNKPNMVPASEVPKDREVRLPLVGHAGKSLSRETGYDWRCVEVEAHGGLVKFHAPNKSCSTWFPPDARVELLPVDDIDEANHCNEAFRKDPHRGEPRGPAADDEGQNQIPDRSLDESERNDQSPDPDYPLNHEEACKKLADGTDRVVERLCKSNGLLHFKRGNSGSYFRKRVEETSSVWIHVDWIGSSGDRYRLVSGPAMGVQSVEDIQAIREAAEELANQIMTKRDQVDKISMILKRQEDLELAATLKLMLDG